MTVPTMVARVTGTPIPMAILSDVERPDLEALGLLAAEAVDEAVGDVLSPCGTCEMVDSGYSPCFNR